jgi:hypothetical protein
VAALGVGRRQRRAEAPGGAPRPLHRHGLATAAERGALDPHLRRGVRARGGPAHDPQLGEAHLAPRGTRPRSHLAHAHRPSTAAAGHGEGLQPGVLDVERGLAEHHAVAGDLHPRDARVHSKEVLGDGAGEPRGEGDGRDLGVVGERDRHPRADELPRARAPRGVEVAVDEVRREVPPVAHGGRHRDDQPEVMHEIDRGRGLRVHPGREEEEAEGDEAHGVMEAPGPRRRRGRGRSGGARGPWPRGCRRGRPRRQPRRGPWGRATPAAGRRAAGPP